MNRKILVVDDDPELLRLIGLSLHKGGYQPVAAQSAEEALRKVRTEQPDLVILDVMLPGATGFEVCRQLRQNAGTVPLPIIILSARTQVDDKIEGLEAGADEYLTKPVSPKELVARVGALLDRTERLRESAGPSRGHVAGFIGAKGGVGTTTVALNVAAALGQAGVKTIAVELHPYYGTFPVHLGQQPTETLSDLWDRENGSSYSQRTLNMALLDDPSGFQVLYAPTTPDTWKEIEPEKAAALIEGVAQMAKYVLLDLPCDMSPATKTALQHCDSITLVSRPEPDSLASASVLLELIKSWGIGRGVVQAVIVNQVPLAMGIDIDAITSQLGCEVAAVLPPAADASALAQKRGRPLILVQPGNPAAGTLKELAQQLVSKG